MCLTITVCLLIVGTHTVLQGILFRGYRERFVVVPSEEGDRWYAVGVETEYVAEGTSPEAAALAYRMGVKHARMEHIRAHGNDLRFWRIPWDPRSGSNPEITELVGRRTRRRSHPLPEE